MSSQISLLGLRALDWPPRSATKDSFSGLYKGEDSSLLAKASKAGCRIYSADGV